MRICIIIAWILLVANTAQLRASIITADVAVHSPSGQYAPLAVGEFGYSNWDRYYWYDVPTFAEDSNFQFWQVEATGFPNLADGITTFEVLTDGMVLMAVTTRWGGGGNTSGGWVDELTTREELEEQGWKEFATGLSDTRDGVTPPVHEYIVFQRESVAGEVFTYRTEKYRAPLIIRSVAAIPEPPTFVILAGLVLCLGLTLFSRRRRSNHLPLLNTGYL